MSAKLLTWVETKDGDCYSEVTSDSGDSHIRFMMKFDENTSNWKIYVQQTNVIAVSSLDNPHILREMSQAYLDRHSDHLMTAPPLAETVNSIG
jgi:hypothetical protein